MEPEAPYRGTYPQSDQFQSRNNNIVNMIIPSTHNSNSTSDDTDVIMMSDKANKSSSEPPAMSFAMRMGSVIPSRRKTEKTVLPADYEPTQFSVICGRGKGSYQSDGNVNFRALVKANLARYKEAPGRLEKSFIVSEVLNMIRESCPVGAFVKYEKGRWWDLDDAVCREKVGSLFRDFLHTEYKSSSKAKHAKKMCEKTKRRKSGASTASGSTGSTSSNSSAGGQSEDEQEHKGTPNAGGVVSVSVSVPATVAVARPKAAVSVVVPSVHPLTIAKSNPAKVAPKAPSKEGEYEPKLTQEEEDDILAHRNYYDIDDLSLRKL